MYEVGEFLREKGTTLMAGREVSEQLLVESFLGFLDKEIDRTVESRAIRQSKGMLHQFEGILLRYEDLQSWKSFLQGLENRKKVKHALLQWMTSEEESPAARCLENATETVGAFYYGEIAGGARRNAFPPVDEASWQRLADVLKKQLCSVVLRELLLRAVRRSLYEQPR